MESYSKLVVVLSEEILTLILLAPRSKIRNLERPSSPSIFLSLFCAMYNSTNS